MRILIATLVLSLAAGPALASPCFTQESQARADAALQQRLQWPTAPAPLITGSLVLDCVGREDLSISCEVKQETPSRYPIAEASLAYAAELRLCRAESARFQLPLTFVNS